MENGRMGEWTAEFLLGSLFWVIRNGEVGEWKQTEGQKDNL